MPPAAAQRLVQGRGVGETIGLGFDPRDATSAQRPAQDFHAAMLQAREGATAAQPLKGLRIGLPKEFFGEGRLHRSVLTHRGAPLPADGILGDVLDFQEGSARDDIAVVAVRVPSRQPTAEKMQVREAGPRGVTS